MRGFSQPLSLLLGLVSGLTAWEGVAGSATPLRGVSPFFVTIGGEGTPAKCGAFSVTSGLIATSTQCLGSIQKNDLQMFVHGGGSSKPQRLSLERGDILRLREDKFFSGVTYIEYKKDSIDPEPKPIEIASREAHTEPGELFVLSTVSSKVGSPRVKWSPCSLWDANPKGNTLVWCYTDSVIPPGSPVVNRASDGYLQLFGMVSSLNSSEGTLGGFYGGVYVDLVPSYLMQEF